jgi:5'-3' exonuclease
MLPEYKANRPEKDAAVLAEMDRCKQALRDGGYLLWAADGFEADDVIATAAHAAAKAGHPFCIASADKDLLQLLALPGSSALRTHTWAMVTAKDVVVKYGIEPEGLGDWLALTGDKSDNIKGCPGVGEKRATELLLKHGGLDVLLGRINALHVGTGTGGVPYVETKTPAAAAIATPAIVDALWKNQGNVVLARKLVELRTDAPIRFEEIHERREKTATKGARMNLDDESDVPFGNPPKLASVPAPAAEPAKPTPEKPAPATAPPVAQVVEPEPLRETSTALVVAEGVEYIRALEPRSSSSAVAMGQILFDSRLFTRFGTAEAVTAVILRGRTLGLGALVALEVFHAIDTPTGLRLAMHAHLITAQAEKDPACEYFRYVSGDNTQATYETKHKNHDGPTRHTYTIQDAVDAGLCGLEIVPRDPKDAKDRRGNWDKRRAEMLRKTCAVQLARIVYPAAAMGLYSVEELDDGQREAA